MTADTIVSGAVEADAPVRDWNDSDRRLITESLGAGQAWEYAAALCNGSKHRFAGSTGEAAAARYLALTLGEIGLSCVACEAFQIQGWQRGAAQLDVLSPEPQRLHPWPWRAPPALPWKGSYRTPAMAPKRSLQRSGR